MQYRFEGRIAQIYGVSEAVFLQNLYWWISKNQAAGRNYYDGKSWTYNTHDAFAKQFPFWTKRQLEGIVQKLRRMGAIEIGNHNACPMDRTQWYTLSETVLRIYAEGEMQTRKQGNANTQTVTCIADDKPDNKPDGTAAVHRWEKKARMQDLPFGDAI